MIDRQKRFDFPPDDAINPPSYQRNLDTKYDGISPREAFQRLKSLTQNNEEVEELALYIIEFMQLNRSNIEQLLQQISSGRIAVNLEQKTNAWNMLGIMHTQNDISNAFALWELNITPIKEECSIWSSHKKMINKFSCLMGRFRSEIEKLTQDCNI